jgi:hypothetical protein
MLIATGQPITAALLRSIYGTDWDTWTPVFTGTGGPTVIGSAGGEWRRVGEKTVIFSVQWTVAVAGTGSSFVTWTLPTAPARFRRWTFPGGNESAIGRPGLYAETFVGGTGAVVDRMRFNGNTNFVASMLEVGQIYQFSGLYREA